MVPDSPVMLPRMEAIGEFRFEQAFRRNRKPIGTINVVLSQSLSRSYPKLERLDNQELKKRTEHAIELLRERDEFLIHFATREETLSHRLAVYLEWVFPGYHVDCEYDKRIDDGEVYDKTRVHGGKESGFRPDIIVHRRGNSQNNLLAIELKKKPNQDRRAEDRSTLEQVTLHNGEYRYQLGLFLDVDNETRQIERTWFEDGEPNS
jgi:hypothetical protein